MSDHDSVRDLLALSAAGLLDPAEERVVREHSRQCAACAAELDAYAALSAGLAALPPPHPPADLVRRTSVMLAAESDRRQGAFLAGVAAISTFVLVLLIGQTLRILEGDSAAMIWLAWASIPSILGAAAALALATRRSLERSTI
jgi:anti-sigma factor RsiW